MANPIQNPVYVTNDSSSPIPVSISVYEQVNAQTGTTYTVLSTDWGKLVTHSNGSAIAVTLPQAGSSFPNGWYYDVVNLGVGTVTITPTTSTIQGAATLVLTTGDGVRIVSDGTNYFYQPGSAAGDATVVKTSGTQTIGGVKTFSSAPVFSAGSSSADNTVYSVAAKGPTLKQGANGRVGTFVANGATPVTVNNTSIAITDAIIISLNTVGGAGPITQPVVLTITASSGFTVGASATDTSTYNYAIIKNAA